MALQLRRGLDGAARTAITPGIGELIYTTDSKKVYVGDGQTAGGNPVSLVSSVNTQTGAVVLTADNIAEASGSPTNLYFTTERAQDAVAAAFVAGNAYNTNITFTYDDANNRITASVPSSNSIINSGTTNSLAYWAANGTTVSPSASLQWNETANLLQNINGTVQVTANNFGRAVVIFDTYANNAGNNILSMQKARGTNITPAVVTASDQIFGLSFEGHDGTGFAVSSSIVAGVASTPSTGIVPGVMTFYTASTAGTLLRRLTIDQTGGLFVGPQGNTDTSAATGSVTIRQNVSSSASTAISGANYYSDAYGAKLNLLKSRGAFAVASRVNVLAGDELGVIQYGGWTQGTAGGNFTISSKINVVAEGSVSTNILPSSMYLYTSNSAGTLTQAMKIGSDQSTTTSGQLIRSINSTVAAAGNAVQASATALTKNINILTTVTGGSATGVQLPVGIAGMVIYVYNSTSTTANVYPVAGGSAQINALGVNTAYTLAGTTGARFVCASATQWYTI